MDKRQDNLYITLKDSPTKTIYKDCHSRQALEGGDADKYLIDQRERIADYLNGMEQAFSEKNNKTDEQQRYSTRSRRRETKKIAFKEEAGDFFSLESSQTTVEKDMEKPRTTETTRSTSKSKYRNIPSLKALIAEAVRLADEEMKRRTPSSSSTSTYKSQSSTNSGSDYSKSSKTHSTSKYKKSMSPKSASTVYTQKPEFDLVATSDTPKSKSKDLHSSKSEIFNRRQKSDVHSVKSSHSGGSCISDDLRRLVFIQIAQNRAKDHINNNCKALNDKTLKNATNNNKPSLKNETETKMATDMQPETDAKDSGDILQVTPEELIINRTVKPVVNELHRLCLNNVSKELQVLTELEDLPKKIHDAIKGFKIFDRK